MERHFTVRPIDPSERSAACQLLGDAFAENPSTLVTARDDRDRARRIIETAARIAKLTRPLAHVLVIESDGELLGVLNAVRSPQCQLRLLEQVRLAPRLLIALRSSTLRLARMAAARARHDPRGPHWHIGPIGVSPDSQGRGVGSMLLDAFLHLADAERTPSFLETDVDRNVTLYERFGFEIVSRATIQGVDTRFMNRPVRLT